MPSSTLKKTDFSLRAGNTVIKYDSLFFDSFQGGHRLEIITKTDLGLTRGDEVQGYFGSGQYFNCVVTNALPGKGQNHITIARELPYLKLQGTISSITWVKTTVPEVLDDLFEMAGISADHSVCPDTEIRHLSVGEGKTFIDVLSHLVRYIEAASGVVLRSIPGNDGTLFLGPPEELLKDSGVSLKTGDTVLSRDRNMITARVLPVLHNQTLKIDGFDYTCRRAHLNCRSGHYRTHLEVTR